MPKSPKDMWSSLNLQNGVPWAIEGDVVPLSDKAFKSIVSKNDDTPLIVVVYRALLVDPLPQKRMDVLNYLESRLLDYYKNRYAEADDIKRFRRELISLKHYLELLAQIVHDNEWIRLKYIEKDGRLSPDKIDSFLYYRFLLTKPSNHEDFLAYSQALYYYRHIDTSVHQVAETLPIYVFSFFNRIVTPNAIEFCQSLLDAETFRNLSNKSSLATVKAFPVALRNLCFDEFIRIKSEEQRKKLAEDNERDVEASIRDGEIELLRNEAQNYKDALDSNNDAELLKMTKYFIRHLRSSLGLENPQETEIDLFSEEFNIPNENNEIDRRIRNVFKTKGLIRCMSDWGAVFKLLVEDGIYSDTDYTAFAQRVNYVCTGGKKVVTKGDAIRNSKALSIIKGTWINEGWRDRENNRKSAGLLLRYVQIAQTYMK